MHTTGSLSDTFNYNDFFQTQSWTIDSIGSHLTLPQHYTRRVFTETEAWFLKDLYSKLYQVPASVLHMSSSYQKYEFAVINGKRFGSHKSRTSTSSLAIATWDDSLFGASSSTITPTLLVTTTVSRAVQINFFCKSFVEINEENKTHLFVSLSWLKPHPKCAELGKPTTVWFYDLFELYGVHSLIPVQFLQSGAVSLIENLNNEPVLFVCPCIDF